ncbi:replication initiation protein [Motilimonas pumila]|uniref:RepB family plasmid replication initiator protein n=1 Tax=Motilimonas pumila TaxID=2303987 RepID=A0A418YA38_9GAMM|nr:replication initiation protein [Motilimonas pumila]RJG38790.1 RepB family plasmid replication initiator protein [Motilimonas pumila]
MSADKQLPAPQQAVNLPRHIKKGHQLVFSRQDLSAREADVFALMMAFMSPDDWNQAETPKYTFKASELSEWLNISSKYVAGTLSPVAERLSTRTVGIKNLKGDEGEFDYIPYFKRIQYKDRMLTITPNDELKSEYIEYNQGFALINAKNFFGLKREYSKRLYEILSRFKTGGTHMPEKSIHELKGLFGLLDENGNLKPNRKSFANNGVFMKRCIRESIEEISTNPETKKELIFFQSPDGENQGIDLIKRGKSIVGIEFLYSWVDKGTVQELNEIEAYKTIRKLEGKRANNTKLTLDELKLLLMAYNAVKQTARAKRVEEAISKRAEEEMQRSTAEDLESLLSKIDELEQTMDDPDY